jgi:predicted nucleotidyltransferase
LTLAVLFGSRATGGAVADSDYDIGIASRAVLALKQELALAEELSEAAGAEIDLVRLDVDNPLLGREAARSGICLFEAEAGTFAAFRADAISRFIDFEETIAPHRALFLRKLAGS